jgi:hypothetical protein
MLAITMPSQPPQPEVLYAVGAVAMAVGLVLLLWGHKVNKVVLAMVGAASAASTAPALSNLVGYANVMVIAIIVAVFAGVATYFLSRILWTAMLGGMLALIAVSVILYINLGNLPAYPVWKGGSAAFLDNWAWILWGHVCDWASVLWDYNALAVGGSLVAPLIMGVVIGIFWPRIMLALVTSLTGGAAIVLGASAIAWGAGKQAVETWINNAHVRGLVACGIALVGLVIQGIALKKSKKKGGKKPGGDAKPAEPAKGKS